MSYMGDYIQLVKSKFDYTGLWFFCVRNWMVCILFITPSTKRDSTI